MPTAFTCPLNQSKSYSFVYWPLTMSSMRTEYSSSPSYFMTCRGLLSDAQSTLWSGSADGLAVGE